MTMAAKGVAKLIEECGELIQIPYWMVAVMLAALLVIAFVCGARYAS